MSIAKLTKKQFIDLCKMRSYTLEETMPSVIKQEDENWYVDTEHKHFPHSHGAGSELKKLFKLVGIKATPTCSCNRRALEMDEKGLSWCKENKETILEWLGEEAKKRKIPFIKFGAEQVLNLAIKRAEKDPRTKP